MSNVELLIRGWRVARAEPSGMVVWFDPTREHVKLFSGGSACDLAIPEEGVDERQLSLYLDSAVSVSALGDGDGDDELPF